MSTASEALRRIPELIPRVENWSTDPRRIPGAAGSYGYGNREEECFCAIGALTFALDAPWGTSRLGVPEDNRPAFNDAVVALADQLEFRSFNPMLAASDIEEWNDAYATLEELHSAALRAAEALDAV